MKLSIKNAIIAKLGTIAKLSEVRGYEGEIENYPLAEVSGVSKDQEREGIKTIYKTYKYKLKVYQEIKSNLRDIKANNDLLETIAEEIDDAFDDDSKLGGAVDDVQLTMARTFEDREILMLVMECEIECKKLKQLT